MVMSPSAVVMMVFSMVVIWGGVVLTALHAIKH